MNLLRRFPMRITPFLKGVVDRLLCNSALPLSGRLHHIKSAASCQFGLPPGSLFL
jgi:hypothetical protein